MHRKIRCVAIEGQAKGGLNQSQGGGVGLSPVKYKLVHAVRDLLNLFDDFAYIKFLIVFFCLFSPRVWSYWRQRL